MTREIYRRTIFPTIVQMQRELQIYVASCFTEQNCFTGRIIRACSARGARPIGARASTECESSTVGRAVVSLWSIRLFFFFRQCAYCVRNAWDFCASRPGVNARVRSPRYVINLESLRVVDARRQSPVRAWREERYVAARRVALKWELARPKRGQPRLGRGARSRTRDRRRCKRKRGEERRESREDNGEGATGRGTRRREERESERDGKKRRGKERERKRASSSEASCCPCHDTNLSRCCSLDRDQRPSVD